RVAPRGDLAHDRDQLAQHLRRRPWRLREPLHARDHLAERRAHDGAVELSLAAEVIADHRLVDAGLLGDRPNRQAVVAALGEELGAGGQQRVARGGGVAAASAAASDSSCGRHSASSLAMDFTDRFQLNIWLITGRVKRGNSDSVEIGAKPERAERRREPNADVRGVAACPGSSPARAGVALYWARGDQ